MLNLVPHFCFCFVAAAGASTNRHIEDELRAALQPVLDAQAKRIDSGVVLSFRNEHLQLELAAGSVQRTNEPERRIAIRPDDLLMWGSITKMYTASGIMQLVERGVVSLNDTAATHVDAVLQRLNGTSMRELFGEIAATQVTIFHLLGMQSGIYDFDDDATRAVCNHNPGVDVSPIDDLAFASTHGKKAQLYRPGTHQDYSSTNFELLGLVLLRHSSAWTEPYIAWDDFDQRDIFGPDNSTLQRRFDETRFAIHGPCSNFTDVHGRMVAPRVHGYEPDDSIGLNFDTYYMSCTNGWTCGNIAAPVAEVTDFVWALYGPEHAIVSEASVELMRSIWAWYGLGTMALPGFREGREFCRVGHLGVTYGFTAAASYMAGWGFALAWGTGQEDPGQTATHGAVYDFLVEFDCVVINKVLSVLSNYTVPEANCSAANDMSWKCQ